MQKSYKISRPAKVVIDVNETTITLKRKGFVNLASHGLKGDKTYKIKNISAVQLKKPGLTRGYIQFTISGGNESRGGIFNATLDENTVMFTSKSYHDMLELKQYIETYDDSTVASAYSPAQQLKDFKNLLDQGIISQNEFDLKKKQILGI